jgi:hypothetical protein
MSYKRQYQDINSSPPSKTGPLFEDDITDDEAEEDIDDAKLELDSYLQEFKAMKETIQKASEGALANKTLTHYRR